MLVWKATFDLSVASIDLVSVDLPSAFEGSGLTIYLERLRSLEHWLVRVWCGCSKIVFFVFEQLLLIMYVVRVLNLNGMLGFYSFLRVF